MHGEKKRIYIYTSTMHRNTFINTFFSNDELIAAVTACERNYEVKVKLIKYVSQNSSHRIRAQIDLDISQ